MRSRIVSSLTLLAAFVALVSMGATNANAATEGTLNLSGSIAAACSIVVTPTAAASALDLVSGETDTNVATVSENCNDADGYTVTVETDTFGSGSARLQGPETYTADFSIKYAGSAVTFTVADTPVTVTDTTDPTDGDNDEAVLINIASAAAYVAGTYSAVLTFTIAAK